MLIFVQCQRNKAGHEGMVLVPGGTLTTIEPLNSHMININIESFLIDKDLVTVADFEAFVNATGYVTEAERFGNSGVFDFEEFGWKIMEGEIGRASCRERVEMSGIGVSVVEEK